MDLMEVWAQLPLGDVASLDSEPLMDFGLLSLLEPPSRPLPLFAIKRADEDDCGRDVGAKPKTEDTPTRKIATERFMVRLLGRLMQVCDWRRFPNYEGITSMSLLRLEGQAE